jgi:Ca2+-binding RTX toxin-like protein
MTNIQTLYLVAGHSYDITLDAGTVTTGQTLTVDGAELASGNSLTFNASALTGGTLTIDAGAGVNDLTGGGGTNIFNMGAYLTASDEINGGTGTSAVHLDGDYSAGLTFNATTMVNVQTVDLAAGHSYNLTLNNATVGSGDTLTIQASTLGAGDSLTLNGSAMDNGNLVVYAGSGTSFIEGGLGADKLYAGSGADTFAYATAGDSTGPTFDTITGFNTSSDMIELTGSLSGVTVVDTAVTTGPLGPTNFNSVLAHDIGASHLQAGGAVLFTPSSGGYSGDTFLIIDENGVAGYQAGQDLVIELAHGVNLASLSVSNFETVG